MSIGDKLFDLAKTKFPSEHRYMMRLWATSWKVAPFLSILAIILISVPALVVGFLAGKQTSSIVINNAPATPAIEPALH